MTSNHEFGAETTAREVADTFGKEIAGKTVVITGVSLESIGSTTALSIASQSPNKIILASLTKPKIEEVARKINEAFPDVQIQIITFDLASQESIRQAAEEINAGTPKIDVLINNAGVVSSARRWTKEGIELQFGANHIGHFLLTSLLIDKLKAAARQSTPGATRVVNITSLAHRLSPIRFHDYNFEGKEIPDDEKPMKGISDRMLRGTDGYPGFLAYGQSKTANVLFASELARRFHDQGINAFSVHPGSIWTDLSRNLDEEDAETITKTSTFWKSREQGAATTIVAAFDPALNNVFGGFMSDCQLAEPAEHAQGFEKGERLWRLSEKLTNQEFKS